MSVFLRRVAPGLFFLLPWAGARAQESIHFASLGGRITDPSGAAVQGARVTARHLDTNLTTEAESGRDGRFRFPFLRIGAYEIRTEAKGFAPLTRPVTLTVGSAFELPVGLTVAGIDTSLRVADEPPVLEAARSQIAGTVSQNEVRNLPLNGRNFLDLALLVPGVSPTNTASNQLFPETSAVPNQGISVASQRNFSNSFIVDGLSANDDAAGLSGIFYGLDVVSEFQVVTSGGQAEYGRALGGYINMVTKSGTNALHGDLYGFFRNQRFNAANPLSNSKLPSTQAQYGASLGGPLRADRTFYFGNFEQRRLNQSGLITISPANVEAINGRLRAAGYAGQLISTGMYPNPVHNTNLLAKVDHQFSARDTFSLRYSLYDVSAQNSRGAGALNAATASSHLDNTDQTVAGSNVFLVSPRTLIETRGQYTRSWLDAPPSDPLGPAVAISGVATFGTLSSSPTGRYNHLYEGVASVAHQAGAHALRAGVDFLYNDLRIAFPRSVHGAYTFASLANFLTGVYNNNGYTQTFGNTSVSQSNPNVGFYAQDEWKVTPRFTLNLGLRYDLQYLATIRTDTNNVSPRAGFAWTPWAGRRTVVRGSYGLFYDRVPLRALANALLSSNNTTALTADSQINVSFSPAQTGAPVFPGTMTAPPAAPIVNFSTMNTGFQNAYSQQGSFEIEHQLGAKTTVSATYQYLRGIRLIAAINQNVPTCATAGSNNGCRPNAAYANNSEYNAAGDSNYHGLHLAFVQRPVRWGSVRASYSLSKSLNNVGEFFFSSPIDPYNLWRDYGRSDDDQRHRFVLDGTAERYGFRLSAMLQYYSALPFNITAGTTTIQGTTARPTVNGEFLSRNAGAGNDFFTLNGRLSRVFSFGERFQVEAIAEAFNALNRRNNLTRNGTFGTGAYPSNPSASFGQITAVQDPRSLQLALRIRF